MAKRKKGPAADALAQLEALEAEEIESPSAPEESLPLPSKKKGSKKKGKKGPAADALAALEELEAAEGEYVNDPNCRMEVKQFVVISHATTLVHIDGRFC